MSEKLRLLTQEEADEYRGFLETYQPSAETVYKFARSRFGVIAGPTGVGKDTLRNNITSSVGFVSILSTTTRPIRSGEQDGVQYHFRDISFVDQGFEERRFLQAEVVHDQQISFLDIAEIDKLNDQQVGLSILIVQTEMKLRNLNRDIMTAFVAPPSLEELERRITSSREMADDEIARRMHAAKTELEIALKQPSYQCVVNDSVERASAVMVDFFTNAKRNEAEDESARSTIASVINEMNQKGFYA